MLTETAHSKGTVVSGSHWKSRIKTGRGAAWLARLLGVQEVAGSNPVAPTSFQNKPFGEYVEGLSHFRAKGYAVELEVQTDDFENLTFRLKIRTSPFLFKTL